MKKRLATLILASAMVLSMAACGNTTSSSKSTTSSKATTSSKTTSSTTSSKAADSSTTTSSKAADSSTATASTPAESSTPATASTPAETSTPAEASTPAETPAGTTDSKTTAAEHTIVGLWRSTTPNTAPGYYTFYDDGFAIFNYYGSGEPTYTYTFENDVLTLNDGEATTVHKCAFDGTYLGLKTEGVEFADTYTALVYSPDEGNIVGMWKTVAEEPLYYTFHEDGKGHVYQPSRKALSHFDYTLEGDQLKGTITGGDALDFDYTISFGGDQFNTLSVIFNGSNQATTLERVLPVNY